jgi:hypothetical protein
VCFCHVFGATLSQARNFSKEIEQRKQVKQGQKESKRIIKKN